MSNNDDFDTNPPPLVELVAEHMAIYGGTLDDGHFMPQAEQLLRTFEAIEGRPSADYPEIEEWSRRHLDIRAARFLVLPSSERTQ
jgi:hypothetical protein